MRDNRAKAPAGVTRAKVAELLEKDIPKRQIALLLGISTQAVHWHAKELERRQKEEASA